MTMSNEEKDNFKVAVFDDIEELEKFFEKNEFSIPQIVTAMSSALYYCPFIPLDFLEDDSEGEKDV